MVCRLFGFPHNWLSPWRSNLFGFVALRDSQGYFPQNIFGDIYGADLSYELVYFFYLEELWVEDEDYSLKIFVDDLRLVERQ